MVGKSLQHHPEHSAESAISVHAVTVAYQHRPVLWDVDFDIPSGSLVAIVGPNGAGKTTLIKACLNLIPRASGTVEYWGRGYKQERARIAYVPQRESVDWDFPVSVLEVVTMGRYGMLGWFRPVTRHHKEAARHFLSLVGMENFSDRQISQLSGGQQQRVFLARALAQEADLYFMDEPFAGVDAATEKAIVKVLQSLKNEGKTVVAVHHDLVTVPEYFDHVVLLNTRVIAVGETTKVFNDENLRKTYGGRLNLLEEVTQAVTRLKRGESIK